LEKVFNKWYPELEEKYEEILQITSFPFDKNSIRIFTSEQITTLHLLMEGKNSKEIAKELGITTGTLKQRIVSLRSKLNARSNKELIELAKYYELM